MPARWRPARAHPVGDAPPIARAPVQRRPRRRLSLAQRLAASPRFRNWALSFPLTRPLARRRARGLFDICAGFVYSQILFACVQLDIFSALADGPLSPETLAQRSGLPLAAMLRLLDSAVALRLLSQDRARRYGLGALGSAMIGSPGIAAMVRHHAMLYADLADPVALLRGERGTELNRYWAYADGQTAGPHPGCVTGYSALMAASQPMVAAEILRAVDLRKHRVLLDAGGGTGAFAVAAARANPGLRVMVLDLPAVAAQARQAFDREGLSDRATATGGTIFEDWPKGATVATLIRVLHDHDDPAVDRILAAAFRALPSGGILVVAEPMAGTRGAEPVGAYFHFYLLAMKQGRPRTVAVIVNAIEKAGFIIVGTPVTRAPLITSIVVARRPPSKV